MPLYEYTCRNCELGCELQAPASKRNEQACPHCKHRTLDRVFSAPAIQYHYPAGHARAGRGGTSAKDS